MKMLKAKLYELEMDKKRKEMEKFYGEKGDIAWGSQIRSYVLQPYQMVKDHRTGVRDRRQRAACWTAISTVSSNRAQEEKVSAMNLLSQICADKRLPKSAARKTARPLEALRMEAEKAPPAALRGRPARRAHGR
jgi:hypothetical protein